MELIKLGSIRFLSEVQMPGFDCGGSWDISFGDTVSGKELQWVKLKSGLLIADRCICTNMSWEQLGREGLVFGTPITIDGETYLCRCLHVGIKEDEPNEWDFALDETDEDNTLWHWKNQFFWGQEISKYGASNRAVRGYYSARTWNYFNATTQYVSVGFRPALEHLGSEPCSPDALLDKKTKVYCSGGATIQGRLVDFSDYDVVLETTSPVAADCSWATKEGRNIIIDRRNINWLKEE